MTEARYIIRGGVEGRERLRLLARVMQPTTLALLERVGIRPGMACLDAGCGGGDVTVELARRVGHGRVLAVDRDEAKLELARSEVAQLQLDNVEFRQLDLAATALEPAFDVIYSRFLLTHLADPAGALAKLVPGLLPGGVLVVEDVDFTGHFCHPEVPAFRRYVNLYTRTVQQAGGDPNIGPRLPGLLLDAGLRDVQLNVVQPAGLEGEVKLVAALTMRNIGDAVVAAGLATTDDVDRLVADLEQAAADPRGVLSLPRIVQTWGRK